MEAVLGAGAAAEPPARVPPAPIPSASVPPAPIQSARETGNAPRGRFFYVCEHRANAVFAVDVPAPPRPNRAPDTHAPDPRPLALLAPDVPGGTTPEYFLKRGEDGRFNEYWGPAPAHAVYLGGVDYQGKYIIASLYSGKKKTGVAYRIGPRNGKARPLPLGEIAFDAVPSPVASLDRGGTHGRDTPRRAL